MRARSAFSAVELEDVPVTLGQGLELAIGTVRAALHPASCAKSATQTISFTRES
jgi:hypothetical protein